MNDPVNSTTEIEDMIRSESIESIRTRLSRIPTKVIEHEATLPVEEPTPSVKIDHTMLPLDALDEVSRALMIGKENHGAWGWAENPITWTELLAKTQRHILAFQRGETIDPTTRLQHLACAICNLMFLQSHVLTGSGTDDRFKR
jgi:hypothetical protein